MMQSAKYSTLKPSSTVLYFDDFERKEILGQPRYGIFDWIAQIFVFLVWLVSLPVTWCFSFKIIPQFERVVIFRLGRVLSLKGPGLVSVIPFVDTWKRVDMRMRAFKVPPQEIITLDHALIKLGADVQYRISDPIANHTMIRDMNHCLRVTGDAALNNQLCQHLLTEIISNKLSLQQKLQGHMNKLVRDWGLEIARYELSSHVVLKDPGGLEPISNCEEAEAGGGAAIMDLIKNFTSSSSLQLPGMSFAPGRNFGSSHPLLPSNTCANKQTSNNAAVMSPQELFCLVKGIINEEVCLQVNAVFEFHVVDGVDTRVWTMDLKNPPGAVKTGCHNDIIDVRFSLDTDIFQKLFYGQVSPTDAYMHGTLRVDGSLEIAKRLKHVIDRMQRL